MPSPLPIQTNTEGEQDNDKLNKCVFVSCIIQKIPPAECIPNFTFCDLVCVSIIFAASGFVTSLPSSVRLINMLVISATRNCIRPGLSVKAAS